MHLYGVSPAEQSMMATYTNNSHANTLMGYLFPLFRCDTRHGPYPFFYDRFSYQDRHATLRDLEFSSKYLPQKGPGYSED